MEGEKADGYVPTDIDSAIPDDPELRRQRVKDMEDITTQRDILLGRIARLQGALYAAQAAGDAARVSELEDRIAALSAECDAL